MFISNADLLDENMADITDWTDSDIGSGTSSQVTFDSKSCMKLETGTTILSGALRIRDVGSYGTRTVVSLSLYSDTVGTSLWECTRLTLQNATHQCSFHFAADGLWVLNSITYVKLGDYVVEDTWQEWTFDIDWTNLLCDIYLNGSLIVENEPVGYAGAVTDGSVALMTSNMTTANRLAYVDWIKVGSLAIEYIDIGIRVRTAGGTITIAAETLTATHKLRIRKGSTTYGIPLLATTDEYASPVRIYDGATVKSIAKVV
jgi:hypothetical protein